MTGAVAMAAARRSSFDGSCEAWPTSGASSGCVREQLGELARRQPVGLGEDEVERDGARAVGLQPVDDLGEARARPRPLADARQRGVVDVDDAHRQCRVDLARRQD